MENNLSIDGCVRYRLERKGKMKRTLFLTELLVSVFEDVFEKSVSGHLFLSLSFSVYSQSLSLRGSSPEVEYNAQHPCTNDA